MNPELATQWIDLNLYIFLTILSIFQNVKQIFSQERFLLFKKDSKMDRIGNVIFYYLL